MPQKQKKQQKIIEIPAVQRFAIRILNTIDHDIEYYSDEIVLEEAERKQVRDFFVTLREFCLERIRD